MKISKWMVLVLLMLGSGSLAFYLWHGYTARQMQRWPATEATVLTCDVTSHTNITQGKLGNRVVRYDDLGFSYSYEVAGREYISRRFYAFGDPPGQAVRRDYPVGKKFSARYNPASPATSVVEPGPLYHRVLVVGLVCFALGVAGIIYNRTLA